MIDKWFALQAGAPRARRPRLRPRAERCCSTRTSRCSNPNRARSLIFTLLPQQPGAFHRPDAAGYVFWADRVIELDAINPQVAARLARALDRWRTLAEPYRSAAREAIARVAAQPELSATTRSEIVTRALQD